jgi:hypothetical protein
VTAVTYIPTKEEAKQFGREDEGHLEKRKMRNRENAGTGDSPFQIQVEGIKVPEVQAENSPAFQRREITRTTLF